jgi:hypothetical protein
MVQGGLESTFFLGRDLKSALKTFAEDAGGGLAGPRRLQPPGSKNSGSPTLRFSRVHRLGHELRPFGFAHTRQDLVHRFLDAGVGAMKFPGGFGSNLTKHITVLHRT